MKREHFEPSNIYWKAHFTEDNFFKQAILFICFHNFKDCVVPENIHTSLTEGIFSNTSPPLWKFQESFIHFFIFFDLLDPPIPGKFQSLL